MHLPYWNKQYIAGIDGLRAIAVLFVLIYHFNKRLLPGGFIGVDVFFVISGYVISKSLAESNLTNFSGFILDFYKRQNPKDSPGVIMLSFCDWRCRKPIHPRCIYKRP